MTIVSLVNLAAFLNNYPIKGSRVADYGGTSKIGAEIVQKMLSLKSVTLKPGDQGDGVNIVIEGEPKKTPPEYIVLDYDNGVDLLKPIKGKKFDAGICMDLLEHTKNPFTVAKNISDSLAPKAYLFVTVPWVWELHYFPKDYWRFAPQGLEALFPDMKAIFVETVRDASPDEELPRQRLVAVFRKK